VNVLRVCEFIKDRYVKSEVECYHTVHILMLLKVTGQVVTLIISIYSKTFLNIQYRYINVVYLESNVGEPT
jgi:hypothetical protein